MQIYKSAEISPCGKYRYRLDRWWGDGRGRVGFLMLNPSTADADLDDATIRKCIGFAQRWGFSGISVVNLYPLRSRDPQELIYEPDHSASDGRNLEMLYAIGRDVEGVICAWGCESVTRKLKDHAAHAEQCTRFLCRQNELTPQQLGPATKTGAPRHPLMAPYSSPRIPFEVRV